MGVNITYLEKLELTNRYIREELVNLQGYIPLNALRDDEKNITLPVIRILLNNHVSNQRVNIYDYKRHSLEKLKEAAIEKVPLLLSLITTEIEVYKDITPPPMFPAQSLN